MSRANSLKKAVRQIIEHAENQIDEQNRRLHNLPEIRLEFAEDEQVIINIDLTEKMNVVTNL